MVDSPNIGDRDDYPSRTTEEGREKGPLVIVREMREAMLNNPGDGRYSVIGASLSWEESQFSGDLHVEFGFEESGIETREFKFEPNVDFVGPQNPWEQVRTTPFKKLGGFSGTIGAMISHMCVNGLEFAKLDAASISSTGNLTSFEFTYEGTISPSDVLPTKDRSVRLADLDPEELAQEAGVRIR